MLVHIDDYRDRAGAGNDDLRSGTAASGSGDGAAGPRLAR
jgi:hypothetical protein